VIQEEGDQVRELPRLLGIFHKVRLKLLQGFALGDRVLLRDLLEDQQLFILQAYCVFSRALTR